MNYNELIKNEKLKLKDNRFFEINGIKYWGYVFRFDTEIKKETEKALLLNIPIGEIDNMGNVVGYITHEIWIPKSSLETTDDFKKQKLEKYQKLVDFATKNGLEIPKYMKSKDIYKMLEERGLKYE